MIRKPIICVLGHVDHGKTKLLDTIRSSTVTEREAGAITQAIGASIVPLETIQRLCGKLIEKTKLEMKLPGLLFIDTPGHAAFSNLRKRGGNLADIAILVIDIHEGFKPQTLEAIEILKKYKTPFIVAVNKIDLISGWHKHEGTLIDEIQKQSTTTIQLFEKKMYEIVAKFYEMGLQAERFDRVEDYTKQLALVPLCAKSGEGIPELLMVLTGLTQKYLQETLEQDAKGPAKGTILEVKEEQGLGITLNAIIYEGTVKVGDTIVIGGVEKPIVTKVKALLEPKPLTEMRDSKSTFKSVREIQAATGVKISAPEIEEVIAGMPFRSATKTTLETVKQEIQHEVDEVLIAVDKEGIIIKADTLGSLEALCSLLRDHNIRIRKASIGEITKKDFVDAESNTTEPLQRVILGFNIQINKEAVDYAKNSSVKTLTNPVIYRLIEDYELWLKSQTKDIEAKEIDALVRPAKFQILRNHTFRQSNPAVVGVDLLVGKIKTGMPVMKQGRTIGTLKTIKIENENVSEAEAPKQIPVGIDQAIVGRSIFEDDILYSAIPEDDFRTLKQLKQYLKPAEIEVMREIAQIMREKNPVWGI